MLRRGQYLSGAQIMLSYKIAVVWLIAALMLASATALPAVAGPPGYLVLRRAESPANHYRPGYYDAGMYDARTSGYAYGFFGVAPRSHWSRHFGTNRNY